MKNTKSLVTSLTAFLLLVCSVNVFAQNAGDLDHSFNPNDGGFFDKWGATGGAVLAVAVQPDGKWLIAGGFTHWNNIPQSRIARLNPDTSIDTTFKPGTGANSGINSMVLLSNGKILIGGAFQQYNGTVVNRIARLNSDGSLDTAFTTAAGTGFNNEVKSVKVLTNGKIVAGGNFTQFNGTARNRVARLNADGSFDATFVIGAGAPTLVNSIAPQPDGKIVIGGRFTTFAGTTANRIVRVDSTGARDTSFQMGTAFNIGVGANNQVNNIYIQPDNKIFVVGTFVGWNGDTVNRLLRLHPNGSRDITFNPGIASLSTVNTAYLLPDGKYLIGGAFTTINGFATARIARLNTDGSVDTTFIGGAASGINCIVPLDNDQILVGGEFTKWSSRDISARLFRIYSDGTGDFTFNSNFSGGTTAANDLVTTTLVQPDGKIVVAGRFSTYYGIQTSGIVRLNPDGTPDTAFIANIPKIPNLGVFEKAALQADGKIVAIGTFTILDSDTLNGIVRLNTDGTRDFLFNTGTRTTNDAGIGGSQSLNSVQVQPDGKIVLVGNFDRFNGELVGGIARLFPDGSLDTAFLANTGTGFRNMGNGPTTVALDTSGKIYISGGFAGWNNHYNSVYQKIIRLHSNGKIDSSFVFGTQFSGIALTGILPLADGSVIVGGEFVSGLQGNSTVRGPFRFLQNGTLDATFTGAPTAAGGNGIESTRFIWDIIQQPDGKLLVIGNFSTYNGETTNKIVRLHPSGAWDETFSSGTGPAGLSQSYGNTDIRMVALYPDNRAIIGGCFTAYNGTGRNYIARIHLKQCATQEGVDVQNICGANTFTWIDGVTYAANNSTATHLLPAGASNGCDSLVTLNLTFLQPATGTDEQTACRSYTWIDGVTYTASNNTATHVIAGGAVNGCDSTITLNLTIAPAINTAVTVSGATLTAVQQGASYQWLDCNNGYAPVAGTEATHRAFVARENGSYAVAITTSGNCSDTSDCIVISHLGIGTTELENSLVIYPNPAGSTVSIALAAEGTYSFTDMVGKTLKTGALNADRTTDIDVSDLQAGIYLVRITTRNGQTAIRKVVKE